MAYNFPVADFSALGDIPNVMAEAKKRQDQQTFANLASDADVSSVKGLTSLAQKAYSQGLFAEGNALIGQANTQRATAQRGLLDAATLEWIRRNPGGIAGAITGAGAGAPVAAPLPEASPVTVSPAAPALAPVPFLPGARSEAPAPQQEAAAAPPVPIPPSLNAPPTPSEQVLSAAEKPAASAASPVQLAGPPPTPDTAPAVNPIPPGASAGTAPTLPTGLTPPPGVPPMGTAVPPRGPMPQTIDPTQDLPQEYKIGEQVIATMPPMRGRNLPGLQLFLDKYRNELQARKISPDMQAYLLENAQRKWAGDPELDHRQYEAMKATTVPNFESMSKAAETYNTAGEAGRGLANNLRTMKEIVNNPSFLAGRPTGGGVTNTSLAGMRDDAVSAIKNLADFVGVPTPEGLTTGPALREAFVGLANRAVIQALGGSLSKGISSTDRDYMARTVPGLLTTKKGSQILIDILDKAAERAQISGNAANLYFKENKYRGSAAEMHLAIKEKMDQYDANHPSLISEMDKQRMNEAVGGETTSSGEGAAIAPSSRDNFPVITGGESALGAAAIAPPSAGALSGLANLISGRAQVPPVTSQSEEDAKRMDELRRFITVQSEERAKHRFRPIVGG